MTQEVSEGIVSVILTVTNWKSTELEQIARIVLRKHPVRSTWQIMTPLYDSKNDMVYVWEGDQSY